MQARVVFTGGGTGGHVFPGLAIIDALKSRGLDSVAWIGGSGGIEQELVRRAGVPFYGVPAGKLRRYVSIRNVIDLFRIAAAVVKSLWLLGRLRPRFLFSKGGYVSVPPVVAARILGIPAVTHESDFDPGLATRLNAPFVDRILIPYEASRECFGRRWQAKLRVTGNPVREAIPRGSRSRGREFLEFPDDRRLLFFVGGSQGAAQINGLVAALLPELLGHAAVVHQRGRHAAPRDDGDGYVSRQFFYEEYADILAASDLVISRAGAGTLWELAAAGKPAILIPLGHGGSRGDQLRNAHVYAASGAAVVLSERSGHEREGGAARHPAGVSRGGAPDGRAHRSAAARSGESVREEAMAGRLRLLIEELLADPERLSRMGRAASGFGAQDVAGRIAEMIVSSLEEEGHAV